MWRCPLSHQTAMAKETALVCPSVRSLLGCTNDEILEVAEDVYQWWYQVVLSILPCQCQDQLMGTSTGSWANSWWGLASVTLQPQTGPYPGVEHTASLGLIHPWWEHAKWPWGDFMMGHSWSRSRHSHNRSWQQWHQSPSLGDPLQSEVHSEASRKETTRHVSPSLSPLHSQCRDEQLHSSFSSLYLQPQQQESPEREASPMQLEIAQTCTAEWSHFPPGSTIECSPQGPIWKHVWFNLTDDLDNALQLASNFAGFLEQPEYATNEWRNTQHLHAPSATVPLIPPKRESDQKCPTITVEFRLKSGTTPSARPAAAGGAKPKHNTMPDLVECPKDWVQTFAGKMKEPPS